MTARTPYGFEEEADDGAEGLLEYLRILRRNKKNIVLTCAGGLLLGFLAGIPMKPVYRARKTLEVLNINEDFMNMKQASPTTSSNGDSYDTSEEETQVRLLQGAALLKRVAGKLCPNSDPAALHKTELPAAGWRRWLHLPQPAQMEQRHSLFAKTAGSLKVHSTPRTRVLEVTADSTDPQFAADFANTLVQEFIQQNLEARYDTTQRTGAWLRNEIDDARAKLQASEDALQAYARQSGLIFTDENTNVATEKLQQIQQQLSVATADRIAKESRYRLSEKSPPDSLADVLGDPGLQATNLKLNDLRRQVASLSAVFNP